MANNEIFTKSVWTKYHVSSAAEKWWITEVAKLRSCKSLHIYLPASAQGYVSPELFLTCRLRGLLNLRSLPSCASYFLPSDSFKVQDVTGPLHPSLPIHGISTLYLHTGALITLEQVKRCRSFTVRVSGGLQSNECLRRMAPMLPCNSQVLAWCFNDANRPSQSIFRSKLWSSSHDSHFAAKVI